MKSKNMLLFLAVVILGLSVPHLLRGQVYYSTLVGTVRDASGAVIPNAAVVATEVSTNEKFPTHTNASGGYSIENLRPGLYRLQAEAPGFKHQLVTDITLVVAQATRVDMTLQVGATAQTVQVSGKVPLIQTESGERAGLMQATEIEEMPLLGRNVMNLALNIPGVVTNQAVQLPYGIPGEPGLRVNGMTEYNNQLRVDGGFLLNQLYGGPVEQIIPDEIAEIKVETSNFTAENGEHAGGVVSIATKHGTNSLHGDLYEYWQNDKLNAANFFASSLPKAPVRYNQFGGTIGGPILKNKLFFFGSYEGVRNISPQTFLTEVPTAAERNGDFSAFTEPIYDPFNIDPTTGNRLQFPGNIVPQDRFDAVSKNYLPFWPAPNISGTPNFTYNGASIQNFDRVSGRIDYNARANILFARYGRQGNPAVSPGTIPGPGNYRAGENAEGTDLVVGWTRQLGPSRFNELRFSMANFYKNFGQGGFSSPNEAVPLGFAFGQYLTGTSAGCPSINFPGYGGTQIAPVCQASFGWIAPARSYYITDDFTFIHGAHTFKTGFFALRYKDNFRIGFTGGGPISFSGLYTAALGDASGKSGNPFADFLLGYQGGLSYNQTGTLSNDRKNQYEGYFQDDWKATRKLTLQLGLRYQISLPLYTTDGKIPAYVANMGSVGYPLHRTGQVYVFAANSRSAVTQALNGQPLGIPYEFESSNWLNLPHYRDVAPRFGFAYRLTGDNRTVIRGGYGIYYSYPEFSGNQPGDPRPFYGANNTPPNPVAAQNGPPPYLLGQSPGAPLLTFPAGTLIPLGYQSDPNGTESGRSQEWNLTFQRALGTDWALEVGYVGNYDVHLANLQSDNMTYMPGFTFHYLDGTTFTITNSTPLLDRKPWPELSSGGMMTPTGQGNYEAAEFSLVKQMSHGLQMRVGYTRSRALGNESELSNFGTQYQNEFDHTMWPTEADTPNAFYVTYVYQLPGQHLSGLRGVAVGGWQAAGIVHIQTGMRSDLRELYPQWPGAASGVIKPLLVCDPNKNAPHTLQEWFNTSCVQQPGVNQFGSDSATNGIVDDPMRNWDASLTKSFKTFENQQLQFRAEFFNAFNHPLFGEPDGYRGDPGFGKVTSAGPARQIQLSLRYEF